MIGKVFDSLKSAAERSGAAGDSPVACPDCGALRERPAGSAGTVLRCEACGAGASVGEWLRASGPAALAAQAAEPPANSALRREGAPPGLVSWQVPAAGRWGFFLPFGLIWCGITGFVSFGMILSALSGEDLSKDHAHWFLIPFFLIFWTIGLGTLYLACRTRFARHTLTLDGDRVVLERHLFGRVKRKLLLRSELKSVALAEFYRVNERPVHGVEIQGKRGKFRFGSALADEEKAWLAADLRRHLIEPDRSAAAATPPSRQSYFSIPLPSGGKGLFGTALGLFLMGSAMFAFGAILIPGSDAPSSASDDAPALLRALDALFDLADSGFRLIWLLVTGAVALAGLGAMCWIASNRDAETRVEATEDEVAIRRYKRGFPVSDRVFPRREVSDVRMFESGSSNGRPRMRVELIVGERAEPLLRWVALDEAERLLREIRGALGLARGDGPPR